MAKISATGKGYFAFENLHVFLYIDLPSCKIDNNM